jgi:uncharacterized membrane protein
MVRRVGKRVRAAAIPAAIAAGSAALLATVSLNQWWRVEASSYDLVIFDQAVRSYSRLGLPVAPVKGVHNGFGPEFSVLGDHLSLVLVLWAPLYWMWDHPTVLLVAQAVLLALAVPPLWVLTSRELGRSAAAAVCIGYGISWPVIASAAFDVHEVAFAPLTIGILLERLFAWRRRAAPVWHVVAAAAGVIAVKEDMGLLLVGVGAAVALDLRSRRGVVLGAGLASGGLAWTALATQVLIPAAGGRGDYYWRYDDLGSGPGEALLTIASHPIDTLVLLVTPGEKAITLGLLVLLTAGAAVLSPYALSVVPLLAARLLSEQPTWWGPGYHYDAFLVVPVLVAGVDAVARRTDGLPHARRRAYRSGWSAAVVVIAVAALPWTAAGALVRPSEWTRDEAAAAAAAAARVIPDGALVEAPNPIGPLLTHRTTVLLWDRDPRMAPWVIVDVGRTHFPFCSLAEQKRRLADLLDEGYRAVVRHGDVVVLHDPAARPLLTGIGARRCGPRQGWVAAMATSMTTEAKNVAPSAEGPNGRPSACSGCGITPTILPVGSLIPAMSRRDPFGFESPYRSTTRPSDSSASRVVSSAT